MEILTEIFEKRTEKQEFINKILTNLKVLFFKDILIKEAKHLNFNDIESAYRRELVWNSNDEKTKNEIINAYNYFKNLFEKSLVYDIGELIDFKMKNFNIYA